jgi:hypothetical protein
VNFTREREMTQPVRRWLQREGLSVKPEFGLPWGICDLVGLSFNEVHVAKRLSYRQNRPIGPLQRIDLLSRIPDRESGSEITFGKLQEWAETASFGSSLERELCALITNKFVVVKKNGCLEKVNGWAPMHQRIVAVEMKLCRISDALSQAQSNRSFAPESYVALPAGIARRFVLTQRLTEFTESGVGILAVTRTTCSVVLPATQRVQPDEVLQTHCVERFWRTRGNSSLIVGPRARVS